MLERLINSYFCKIKKQNERKKMCTIKTILTTVHFDIKKFSPRRIIQTIEKTNIELFKQLDVGL